MDSSLDGVVVGKIFDVFASGGSEYLRKKRILLLFPFIRQSLYK